jgi:hypothetical protein
MCVCVCMYVRPPLSLSLAVCLAVCLSLSLSLFVSVPLSISDVSSRISHSVLLLSSFRFFILFTLYNACLHSYVKITHPYCNTHSNARMTANISNHTNTHTHTPFVRVKLKLSDSDQAINVAAAPSVTSQHICM